MAQNAEFQLFSNSDEKPPPTAGLGLEFLDSPQPDLPPPPPPIEVFYSEVSPSVKFAVDGVNVGDLSLLKGRVSTKEVFGLPNSDLVPGVYEGGLKLWEGSVDLVRALQSELKHRQLTFDGKRVLELGCGHGLPGIFACIEGAAAIHFQDFNAEVLRCLTIPNVRANLLEKASLLDKITGNTEAKVRFFAGDWVEVDQLFQGQDNETCSSRSSATSSYDIILMAETIYSTSAQQNLYGLIKKCLAYPHGVVYMAAKKYYFGVGGGTRQFLSMIEKDGMLAFSLVAKVTDGASNVREVWKLMFK